MFRRANLILSPPKINIQKRNAAKFVLPERFKGTVVEKWAEYWKNLFADYKSMVTDFRVEVQENPRRAIKYTIGAVIVTSLASNNPTMTDFCEQKIQYSNELALIGESVRNPKSVSYLKDMETSLIQGTLRRLNCGVFSLLWTDDCDPQCDMYLFRCPYTAPGYLTPFTRIVDIGIMGQWWNIYRLFQDFDINEE